VTSIEQRPGAFARATYGMRAIRSRKLQLLLLAQLTSQAGYFTFYVSQAWLALELTNSPGLVTMISTAGVAPFLFFAIPAGALADRANRRRLMLGSRALTVVAFTAEGLLVATGLIQPWHMLTVAFIAGIGIAIDNPAQFKSIADAVRPDEIPSASALVALDFQVSVILGPILGGLLLEAYGPAPGIFAAAAGNVALLLCYLALRIPTARGQTGESPWIGAVQGLRFVFTSRVVGLCALLWSVMILVINPYQALMSVFARDEIHTGGFGLGLLLTAPGVGAIVGSTLAGYDRVFKPGVGAMATGLIVTGVALGVLGWAGGINAALWLLGALGVGFGFMYVLGNSIPLMATPLHLRGRVISVFLWLWGISPIGSTVAGFIAGETSTRVVFALAGQVAAVVGVLVLVLSFALGRRRHEAAPVVVAEVSGSRAAGG